MPAPIMLSGLWSLVSFPKSCSIWKQAFELCYPVSGLFFTVVDEVKMRTGPLRGAFKRKTGRIPSRFW